MRPRVCDVLAWINEPPVVNVIDFTVGLMLPLPAVKLNSPTMLFTPEMEFGSRTKHQLPATSSGRP